MAAAKGRSNASPTYPVATIAKLLMLSERRVQQLTKEAVIPRAERGRYELAPAVQGYVRYLQARTIGSGSGGAIDFHVEKARLTKAQADLSELELARARELVAPLDQVERMVSRAFAQVRTGFLNLPGRTVAMLIGETDERRFKAVLKGEIDQILVALSSATLVDEDDSEESDEAA